MSMKKKTRTPAQIAADAKRTGRPPKRPQDRQSLTIGVKVTPAQKRRVAKAARAAGMHLGPYLLHCFEQRED